MFIGHFGIGLIGKKVAPRASLGTWFLSTQLLDGLWPIFLLLGWEHVKIQPGITKFTPLNLYDYPISHSLLIVICWSLLFGLIYYAVRRNKKVAILLGLGVASHWLLDFIVHRPDLPIIPGGHTYAGLDLWDYPVLTMLLEIPLYLVGVYLYFRSTRAKDKIGIIAPWFFFIFLFIAYFMSSFGPPPPDVNTLAWVGMTGWLMMVYTYWFDRHREPVTSFNPP